MLALKMAYFPFPVHYMLKLEYLKASNSTPWGDKNMCPGIVVNLILYNFSLKHFFDKNFIFYSVLPKVNPYSPFKYM